ncbi:hypothetical protein LSCM1_02213 [Leishmania martiniquensis]|uniref:Kinesin motor domain-containing protein n=1 Tax=Leishmania martiniquensis TaxID=1580590 RepID=A0A836H0P5_9TRYP|nr:hypothetical protein LSCM1_02213 [Leishmania martiniquensis]
MNDGDSRGDLGLLPSTVVQVARNECDADASTGHVVKSSAYIDPAAPRGPTATQETLDEGNRRFSRVRVIVRCRPLPPSTEIGHSAECVHVNGDEVIILDKAQQNKCRSYRFDRVLSPEADQATIFAEIAPLVEHVLDGFHATVFVYGQTGSGKTYTMDGLRYASNSKQRKAMAPDVEGTPVQQHGIMPRAIQLLFDRARERQGATVSDDAAAEESIETPGDGVEYTFRCSFYQIYNEKISDLLRGTCVSADGAGEGLPSSSLFSSLAAGRPKMDVSRSKGVDQGDLRVRWHSGDTFRVENLFICTCRSPDEMRAMLFRGVQQKVMSSHLMNHQSSRSHCTFTIYVESRARRSGELLSLSEFSLVDLAGSEKIGHLSHSPSAKLVKESIDINTSLLALGKVITALSSGASAAASAHQRKSRGLVPRARCGAEYGAAARHIPYRDSKLTMLLKHALGGNSLTIMIACINLSDRYVEETTSTLLYAGRAKNIRNVPYVNEDATTLLVRRLREEIAQLKVELGYYHEMAAKSLVEREGGAEVCKRCGHGVYTTSRLLSDSLSPTRYNTPESVATGLEMDQLAESLVAACAMLTNLMQVNSQLRELYDEVRDVQNAAERREADVNAENLALRERLALLEDIVLEDGEVLEELSEAKTLRSAQARDVEETCDHRKPPERARTARKIEKSAHALEDTLAVTTEPSSAAELRRRTDDSGRGSEAADDSTGRRSSPQPMNSSPTISGIPAAVKRENHEPSRAVSTAPLTPQVSPSSTKSVAPACGSSSGALSSPAAAAAFAPPDVVEQPSMVPREMQPDRVLFGGLSDVSPQHPADGASSRRRATGGEEKRWPQYPKKKHKKHKKHRGRLARRLKEYEARYRAPHIVETYADYYQVPARTKGTATVVPGVPPIRASEAAAAQVTAALEDMKATVSKLPKSVVREYVPTSLLQPGAFGSLAFGGGDDERAPFEENRTAREGRLRAALQRQQELYQQLRAAAHGPRFEDHQSASISLSTASAASPETSAPEGGHSSSGRANLAGSREEVKRSRSGVSHPICAPTRYCAPQTVVRTGTASYSEPSRPQRPCASSVSMTKLMEYLERDT